MASRKAKESPDLESEWCRSDGRRTSGGPAVRGAVVDLSWITAQLAVGGGVSFEAVAVLAAEHRVKRVVDLRIECCDDELLLSSHGLELLHLPTEDMCAVSQTMLDEGVLWIRDGMQKGERVFVHCQHGIGRSALLAACVLVSCGDRPEWALARLKRARSVVSPSPPQLEAFMSWSARWGVDPPSFEALARVVYR